MVNTINPDNSEFEGNPGDENSPKVVRIEDESGVVRDFSVAEYARLKKSSGGGDIDANSDNQPEQETHPSVDSIISPTDSNNASTRRTEVHPRRYRRNPLVDKRVDNRRDRVPQPQQTVSQKRKVPARKKPVAKIAGLAAIAALGGYAHHYASTATNADVAERKIVRTINNRLENEEGNGEPTKIRIETLEAQGYEHSAFPEARELVLSETTGEPEAIRTSDDTLVRLGKPSIIVQEVDGVDRLYRAFSFYDKGGNPWVLVEVPNLGYLYYEYNKEDKTKAP